jgi:hypothetical protein
MRPIVRPTLGIIRTHSPSPSRATPLPPKIFPPQGNERFSNFSQRQPVMHTRAMKMNGPDRSLRSDSPLRAKLLRRQHVTEEMGHSIDGHHSRVRDWLGRDGVIPPPTPPRPSSRRRFPASAVPLSESNLSTAQEIEKQNEESDQNFTINLQDIDKLNEQLDKLLKTNIEVGDDQEEKFDEDVDETQIHVFSPLSDNSDLSVPFALSPTLEFHSPHPSVQESLLTDRLSGLEDKSYNHLDHDYYDFLEMRKNVKMGGFRGQ